MHIDEHMNICASITCEYNFCFFILVLVSSSINALHIKCELHATDGLIKRTRKWKRRKNENEKSQIKKRLSHTKSARRIDALVSFPNQHPNNDVVQIRVDDVQHIALPKSCVFGVCVCECLEIKLVPPVDAFN